MRPVAAAGLDERALVASFLERRADWAFRELYRRHTPRLYQLVLRLRGWHRRDAEEVVQETWLRAARGLERFRFEASLQTWLTAIALNVSRELDRERSAHDQPLSLERAATLPAVGGRGGDTRIDLETAIAALPAGYRQVLVLHDVEGYTHREIAELLGIEEGTSKSQLSHARRKLRRRLRAEPPSERTERRSR